MTQTEAASSTLIRLTFVAAATLVAGSTFGVQIRETSPAPLLRRSEGHPDVQPTKTVGEAEFESSEFIHVEANAGCESELIEPADVLLRIQIRDALAEFGEVDEEGFGSKAMTCYLENGDVHLWLGGRRSNWKWWTVTLDEGGISRLSQKSPVTGTSIDEIRIVARSLAG